LLWVYIAELDLQLFEIWQWRKWDIHTGLHALTVQKRNMLCDVGNQYRLHLLCAGIACQ
jgi:hypothetical protein